jgi:hypothetical protein
LSWGNNLTGTTGVSFNGTAAAFTIVSNSEIKTTAASGATPGVYRARKPHLPDPITGDNSDNAKVIVGIVTGVVFVQSLVLVGLGSLGSRKVGEITRRPSSTEGQ